MTDQVLENVSTERLVEELLSRAPTPPKVRTISGMMGLWRCVMLKVRGGWVLLQAQEGTGV